MTSDQLAALSSKVLVSHAQQGSQDAFEELYHRYYAPVVRRISHLMGPQDGIADLVQETFMHAYKHLHQFRGDSEFGAWLLGIATNLTRSHYRRQYRWPWRLWNNLENIALKLQSLENVDATYPTLDVVHRALTHLSPALREAVILFDLEGATLADIASQCQIPLHTAASRVRRGREQLRRALERLGCSPIIEQSVAICGSKE